MEREFVPRYHSPFQQPSRAWFWALNNARRVRLEPVGLSRRFLVFLRSSLLDKHSHVRYTIGANDKTAELWLT